MNAITIGPSVAPIGDKFKLIETVTLPDGAGAHKPYMVMKRGLNGGAFTIVAQGKTDENGIISIGGLQDNSGIIYAVFVADNSQQYQAVSVFGRTATADGSRAE